MDSLRSRVDDLQVHCYPCDKNAARELRPPSNPLVTSYARPALCANAEEMFERHGGAKFSDITGSRYGNLVVVGLIEWRPIGRSQWCVQCRCGRYEARNYRNIVRGIESGRDAECHVCSANSGRWLEGASQVIGRLAKKLDLEAGNGNTDR